MYRWLPKKTKLFVATDSNSFCVAKSPTNSATSFLYVLPFISKNEFGFGLSTINNEAFKGLESSGNYGTPSYNPIAVWDEDVAPYPTDEEIQAAITTGSWKKVRTERNKRLADTDWHALSDVTMSEEITAYRQTLRDIPQT